MAVPNGEKNWRDGFDIINVGNNRINRLNDRFIKSLLTGPQSKPILIDFINDALLFEGENAIADLEVVSGELVQDFSRMKLSLLDISAKFEDGRTCDIEVQVVNRHDFEKRAPYYWAMRHVHKLRENMTYMEIKPTICICLLAFNLFANETNYRNAYSIRNDESGNILTDDLQIIYLELPKFRSQVDVPRTGLERWLLYFSNEEESKMDKIAAVDPAIGQALHFERAFWSSEEERERYFAVQKRLLDEVSAERSHEVLLKMRTEEAEAKGLERGEHKKAVEIAGRLLDLGVDSETVAKGSGLPLDEIQKMKS